MEAVNYQSIFNGMKAVKIIIALVVLALVAWGLTLLSNKTPVAEAGPIKIGFVGPLSGDGASFGETEKNATEMALAEIKSSDVFKNRTIEIVYEDGKCNGKDATTAAQKLIQVDKVKVILGGVCSSETLAIAPIVEQNKVVLFSAFSSNPAITNSGDFVFRNAPSDSDVAKLDAQAIMNKSYKKVAIVSEINDYAQGVLKIMKETLAFANVPVVLDESFKSGTTDFRDIVLKVKQSGADVVYINPGSSGKTAGLFVKQLKETGVKIAIHGNFTLGTPDAFATAGTYLEGVIISDGAPNGQKLSSLLDAYQTQFGNKAANDFEFGAAYDRMKIVAQAIAAVGDDSEKIKQYLYQMPPNLINLVDGTRIAGN